MVGRHRSTSRASIYRYRCIHWNGLFIPPIHDTSALCEPGKARREAVRSSFRLGCKKWQGFLDVTLPLSMPGIIAGCLLVFIPAIGEYVIPALLGGADTLMIGRVLFDEFFLNRDWPVASAVAIVLLLLLVLPIVYFQKKQAQETSEATA